jgi:enoyl-CoA hydratase/carnithine racemase
MWPLTCRETPVAAQIILRRGLRHFSAGADLDIFDKRAEQGRVDLASESRRLNGVEYLRFMELPADRVDRERPRTCRLAAPGW